MRDIADKEVMTVMTDAGTAETPVPDSLRTRSSLDDEQAFAIADLAARLDAHLGYPVDIECAIAGGELFLLQCRPITTLG
jgi:pyruvate,water dikinase